MCEEGSCTIKPCFPCLLRAAVSRRRGEQLPVTGTSVASASDLRAVTSEQPRPQPHTARTKRRGPAGPGAPLGETPTPHTSGGGHRGRLSDRGAQDAAEHGGGGEDGSSGPHGAAGHAGSAEGPRGGGRAHTRVFARVHVHVSMPVCVCRGCACAPVCVCNDERVCARSVGVRACPCVCGGREGGDSPGSARRPHRGAHRRATGQGFTLATGTGREPAEPDGLAPSWSIKVRVFGKS